MVRGLNQLVGEKIETIVVDPKTLDVAISFSNSLLLKIICEPNVNSYEQYTIQTRELSITVESDMSVTTEMRVHNG